MRQLTDAEFGRIEGELDRSLWALIGRQNTIGAIAGAKELTSMSAKFKSLAGNLDGLIARLNAVSAAQEKMTKAVERADAAANKVNALADEVNQASAHIEALVGQETNGPPA